MGLVRSSPPRPPAPHSPSARAARSRWGPGALLLLSLALGGGERALEAEPPGRGERVLAGLSSVDLAKRRSSLADLPAVVAEAPELAPRALPALREILRRGSEEERSAVARALAGTAHPEAERAWLALALDDAEPEPLLRAAQDGLVGRVRGEDLALRLLEASNDKQRPSAQRALALEALGALGGGAADLRLGLTRPGADWVEEAGRALGLGRRGDARSIGRLIELLGSEDACPRVHAWEELCRLTRQRLPVEQAPWEAWWLAERVKQAEVPGATPPAPPDASQPEGAKPDDRYARPDAQHVPRYYGVPIPRRADGSRVVFCCDVSQSMYGFPLDRSRKELLATLKDLTTHDRFDVIAFNEVALPWAGRLVRAHPVQKVRAMDWFLALEPTSYTNIYDAVEIGMGYAGRGRKKLAPAERLDALFLLTDGEPNRGRYREPKELLRELSELASPGIPIHTIGAGEAAYDLLRKIAAATGGTFTDAFD